MPTEPDDNYLKGYFEKHRTDSIRIPTQVIQPRWYPERIVIFEDISAGYATGKQAHDF